MGITSAAYVVESVWKTPASSQKISRAKPFYDNIPHAKPQMISLVINIQI